MSSELDAPREAEPNPYAAPDAEIGAPFVELVGPEAEAERIRREYLGREASVKLIGSLHLLFAILGVVAIVALIVAAVQSAGRPDERVALFIGLVLYVIVTGINFALAIGLTRLQVWARWTDVALAGIGLAFSLLVEASVIFLMALNRPMAMMWPVLIVYGVFVLVLGFILYLLISPRSSVVFSARYKAIIAQTPHIKYRTSPLVKIGLVLLLAVLVLAFLGFYFAPRR